MPPRKKQPTGQASCAHCSNSGIIKEGGREWRCGKCSRVPRRKLKTKRVVEFGLPRIDPYAQGPPRVIDTGARTQTCGVEGCTELTTNKKPFCPAHVDRIGHAESLAHELRERDAELERVVAAGEHGWRLVDVDGSRAQEILNLLETQGSQTPERLANLVTMTQRALPSYVRALEKIGRVKVIGFRTGSHGAKVLVTLVRPSGSRSR